MSPSVFVKWSIQLCINVVRVNPCGKQRQVKDWHHFKRDKETAGFTQTS